MSELLKKISSADFIPEKCKYFFFYQSHLLSTSFQFFILHLNKFCLDVKDISQVCIGGLELQKHKAAVTALSEQTNLALKKNVYKNYMQFIETAREISRIL